MAIKYNEDENNAVDVVESCNYYYNFMCELKDKCGYDYHEFKHFIYDLSNLYDELEPHIYHIIINRYPIIWDCYLKNKNNLSINDFVLYSDLPYIHMQYIDTQIRLEKIKKLTNA